MSKIILLIILSILIYRTVSRFTISGGFRKPPPKSPDKKFDFTKDKDIADGDFKEL